MDCSPPDSSFHRILQARILEWVAISFSRGSSWPRDRTQSPALQADTLTSEPPGKPYESGSEKWKWKWKRSVVSDSVWPHRRQPTRLPSPWDSPGKNTGVDCHVLLQCMKVKSESEVAQLCLTLSNPMDCSLPGSSIHGIFQARVLECVAIAFSSTTVLI